MPLVAELVNDGHSEAAAMVIDAILFSTPNVAGLIRLRALQEASFEPHKAVQSFSEYLQLEGGHASDYVLYSQLLHQVDDPQGAANALRHAIAVCEPSDRFTILVGCAHCKVAMSKWQGALRDLSEADTLGQLDFDDVKQLAELYSAYGDVATAVALFDRAAVMDPSNARVRQQRGACKSTLEDTSGAIADLDAAILLGLDNTLTYRYRGVVYMKMGQFKAVLADFDQAVTKRTELGYHREALLWRAAARFELGDIQGAVADMDAAHEISPLSDADQHNSQAYRQQLAKHTEVDTNEQGTDAVEGVSDADALYREAHAKRGKNDLTGALCALHKAIVLQPQDVRLYQERAAVQMRMFKYAEALQDLQTLIAIDSSWDVVNVLKMCGVCKNKLGRDQEALADLDKALLRNPFDVDVLIERAVARFTLLDFEGALADANTAINRGLLSGRALTTRGAILCMLGQQEAALLDLDLADGMWPNNADTLMWRAFVKGDQEDWAGALADFDAAEQHARLDWHALEQRAFAKGKLGMACNADKA